MMEEDKTMKRLFLILAILAAMAVGSACSRKGAQTPTKPVTMQQKTEPTKAPPVVSTAPEAQPKEVPPVARPSAPKIRRPKAVQPRVAVAPKAQPPAVAPKTEPPAVAQPQPKAAPPAAVPTPVSKPRWQVSIVDHWLVRHPSALARDLIAITFVVRNTAPKDVKVKVVCHFADDGSLFGESMPNTVDANSTAKLMVRGFWRCPDGLACRESFDCRVEPVK